MDTHPKIILPTSDGFHNQDFNTSAQRIDKSMLSHVQSTIIICPTRGMIPARVVQSWMGLIRPMNQMITNPMFASGLEVGSAYNAMIEAIKGNGSPFAQFKYILTIEEDNIPPPDGLLKLFESIEGSVDGKIYDVVGGLYWTKGEGGMPMIYGNPFEMPKNFLPQVPIAESIQPANGLGMGFTLFRSALFDKVPKPWFRTLNGNATDRPGQMYTQDLYFFENAAKYGGRFACDTRVKVGHYDYGADIVW
jgi:hypothetical protein